MQASGACEERRLHNLAALLADASPDARPHSIPIMQWV